MKFKEFINEGGNATATIKKTGKNTLAQKIPLKEIGRSKFIKKFTQIFMYINKLYKSHYKEPLWKNTSILKNGLAFNGSTSFIMNPEIADKDVIPFKPKSGDLDIMIPSYKAKNLWHVLDSIEDKEILPDVIYKGCNKLNPESMGLQINSVFEVKFGDIITQSQVDFEFAEFDKAGVPDEFSRFAHSSALPDAAKGFKGVAHKFILRSLAGGKSRRDDVIVLTPKATYEKPTIKKVKGVPLVPNFLKFSVDKGLSYAYEQQFTPSGDVWKIDGKFVYKEVPSKNRNYDTSILTIFKALFGNANSSDLGKMWSFVGIVELMRKYLDKKAQERTFKRMLELCFGKYAQALERDDYKIDMDIKIPIINYMIKKLKLSDSGVQKMIDEYYSNYRTKKISESFRTFIQV